MGESFRHLDRSGAAHKSAPTIRRVRRRSEAVPGFKPGHSVLIRNCRRRSRKPKRPIAVVRLLLFGSNKTRCCASEAGQTTALQDAVCRTALLMLISNTCEIPDAHGDNNKDNGKHWNNEADPESSERQSNYIDKLKSSTCTFNKHHGTTAS